VGASEGDAVRSLTEMPPQPFPDRNLPPVKVSTGDLIVSASGRSLAAVPRIDLTTVRRCNDSMKRLATWLCEEARCEAEFRRDDFNGQMFRAMKPMALSQADRDTLNLYLFANINGVPVDLVCHAKENMCPLDVVVNGSRLPSGQADRPLATYP
jgi:hypothetical protein